jgi:hypothetical protein
LHKAASPEALIDAVRTVARGDRLPPPRSPNVMEQVSASLDADDLPIVGMLVNGTPRHEVPEVLGLTEAQFLARAAAIVDRIKTSISTDDH